MSRGRHRRARRQVPLLLGALASMAAGAVVAVLAIGASLVVGGLLLLVGVGYAISRRL